MIEDSAPGPDKDFAVLGRGDIVISVDDHPRISSLRLRDVFYYRTDKPRNIINLELLQQDHPELIQGKMKFGTYGTAIVHADDPEKVVLQVDAYDDRED